MDKGDTVQEVTMTASEFRKAFGKTLDRVCRGEEVVLTNHTKPWVALKPPIKIADKQIKQVTAFDLRLNIKEWLDKVHHSDQSLAIVRKKVTVAIIEAIQ